MRINTQFWRWLFAQLMKRAPSHQLSALSGQSDNSSLDAETGIGLIKNSVQVPQLPRKLHIGGTAFSAEWEILNALPGPHVDHIGNANDLSRFSDNVFSEIYASHIVEHLDYNGELQAALKEWYRVLKPGGRIYISVPDLDILARLFIDKTQLTLDERFAVMRMMFGGHVDKFDYHVVGLNHEILAAYLLAAGFETIVRTDEFRIFQDTSSMRYKGTLISLNLTAVKAGVDEGNQQNI
jgi:predicted SAM-dependent methyltransferase